MGEPRVKRPKISRGDDDYVPGNITEIELHNFMTFSDLVCKPGSRLNLVIGPNGSGKSSLVCAIALGLGGEPALLGRAMNIGAFVKRGEETGYIKISLRGCTKEEKITVVRKIDTRNKSEWLYNGKSVPKREILEVMSKFNIQVNNLTQFLPQDRVCEFAKLTPVQLLGETEKAVGDPQLPLQHHALVEKTYELKRFQKAVETMGESLKQLMALNAEQEKYVERIRQRNELLEKVDHMKKKLPWLKYDMKLAEYGIAQKKVEDAEEKLNEAAKTLSDLKAPIEKQKQEKAKLDDECKQISNLMNENVRKRANLLEKENEAAVQMRSRHRDVNDMREKEDSRKQRIQENEKKLAAAEEELLNLPPYKPPQEIERLAKEIVETRSVVREKMRQKEEKERRLGQLKSALRNCVDSLTDLENTNTKLLYALKNSGAEKICDAYRWVQEHRRELNKEVFGPVLLEVKVSDQRHAKFLEGHVARYIWKSFITQDSGDRDFLVKNLRPFDVPILNYVRDESGRKEPFEITEQMHELGIYSRLDQVFDAPTAVKEVLTSQFILDRSYIGSGKTDRNADDVAKLGILDFWTPENHYHWSFSRYGDQALSATVEPVADSRLLLCGSDSGEIEKLKSRKIELETSVTEVEKGIKSLQIEKRLLEDEAAKLDKQREEMVSTGRLEKKRRRDLENSIDQMKRKLASWNEGDDLETAVAKLIDQAKRYNIERFKHAIKIKDLLVEAVSCKWSFAEKHMTSIDYHAKIRWLEDSLKKHEKFAEEASLQLQYSKKEKENYRQELLAAKKHAESIAIITPELKEIFLQMPTTIEELEAAIQDNISQANSVFCLNGTNILLEYEDRRRQIETISEKLEADNNKLQKCLAEIDALKGTWLPTLRNLVNQINETFSRNFQEMAVAGEVSLDEHDADFDQYGILIKVKFRQAGQLKVLSAHHQSGGERSVSTILYLVSLQDLTNCPFRVVDEINQGMDPINERKMFQQLVRAASQPNTPQCFLLTPKLLPNLEYSEACSILNIMNGPWIETSAQVWRSGERWGTITGLVEESRC